ncbi:MAG TPA: adenylate/guanylate cyclase domain-containing protein [Rhizobiales bacterium]|nr:adenylate/guanylate cyclase domain-containing protein [Hyphomicrobiales bacterium]
MARRTKPYKMPGFVRTAIEAGTGGYPEADRQRLVVINIVGFLAALSSLNYAATYATYDYQTLWPLVVANIGSAAMTASAPLLHRFGRLAAMVFLIVVIYSTIFYFVSYLGRNSGIQLNYIGAAAVVLVVCGQKYLRYVGIAVLLAGVLHLVVWFKYPAPRSDIQVEDWFLANLYTFSTISIMVIIFVVVFYAFHLVRKAQARTDTLLLNIMPEEIAGRLKAEPGKTIADQYENASVIFADLTGFTSLTTALGPDKTVILLDDLFSRFDALAERYNVEKIKTIGDAYMAVAGIPVPDTGHGKNITAMAIGFLAAAKTVANNHGVDFNLRIGIACGPVMAGIIGKSKFSYDVWGETVNRAARLEPQGQPGSILIDEILHEKIKDDFTFKGARKLSLKGLGRTTAWEIDYGD